MRTTGVIEGFYGPPWTTAERTRLLARMQASGLDTYLYGPKDDLHHRAIWREPYGAADAQVLADLIADCHTHGIRFVYGIGPGLDLRYDDVGDRERLRARCAQMLALGADGIALLFDDIPGDLDAGSLTRWGSLSAAHAGVANELFAWIRMQRADSFAAVCPTPYCDRMAAAALGGSGYLDTLGATLRDDIAIFWTGPEIVSREITVVQARDVAARLRRLPLLWDNLHANDYDSQRMLCGPYDGRPLALRDHLSGLLSNPNTEFPLNVVALRTLADFVHATDSYDARAAYRDALADWQPAFETVTGPVALDDLELLMDAFYLPFDDGPRAVALRESAASALTDPAPTWVDAAARFEKDATRLRDLCGRLATLRDRSLFQALHRRIWDLREELDLLLRAVAARRRAGGGPWTVHSEYHLPGTYRGGLVASLRRLLIPGPDGAFAAAAPPPPVTSS